MPKGMIDKLLGAMKLSYDYDEYDEYSNLEYDDEDEELEPESEPENQEAPKEKKSFFRRKKTSNVEQETSTDSDEKKEKTVREKTTYRSKNVVPIKGGVDINNMEVCMVCPKTEAHKKEIADTLLSGKSIVINMEGLDVDFAQSIVDFTSGACYAIDGDLKQISKYIFIATPETVELVGEFMDIAKSKNEHVFDMSGSGFTNKF